MSSPYTKLIAALAVAAFCLSPIVTATAALAADQSPDVGYARNGGLVTDEPDVGFARNGGVVVAGTDPGFARNGGVVVDAGAAPRSPARADGGVDVETVVLATLTLVVIVGAGVVSFLVGWRRHHHLAHPA
ncbi:MAG: hypothetical protein ACRDOW_01865 [Nocardioidaceae bacterium]